MQIVSCQYESHGQAILKIFNEVIASSTALYDYEPRTLATVRDWFDSKSKHNYPVIGIEDNNTLVGFATYGGFRSWAAYKYSVEHSIYVRANSRGKGIGKKLLTELIQLAEKQQYHTLIGAIDAENKSSIRLHQSLGFVPCGTIKQVGFKFDKWLDLEFYQLILATPNKPIED